MSRYSMSMLFIIRQNIFYNMNMGSKLIIFHSSFCMGFSINIHNSNTIYATEMNYYVYVLIIAAVFNRQMAYCTRKHLNYQNSYQRKNQLTVYTIMKHESLCTLATKIHLFLGLSLKFQFRVCVRSVFS